MYDLSMNSQINSNYPDLFSNDFDIPYFSKNTDLNASEMSHQPHQGVFTTENEFTLYERFNNDNTRPMGPLYKVKSIDPNKYFSFPMLARVINFKQV